MERLRLPIRWLVAPLFLVSLFTWGCSDSATAPGEPAAPDPTPDPTPDRIELSVSAVAFSYLGETTVVTGQVLDSQGGSVEGATLDWSSSDPDVVSVSGGTITSVGPGGATVTASYQGLSADVEINIVQEPASLSLVSGGGQPVLVGSEVPDPIRVKLLDQGGSPIPGRPIAVQVMVGGGTLAAPTVETDEDGEADLPAWTVDGEPGPQTVAAEAGVASLVVSVNAVRTPATISVPDAQILAGGHLHEEAATVDETQLVVILQGDDVFAHFPMAGGPPDLTPEGTFRALREWMLFAFGEDGIRSPAPPAGSVPQYDPFVGIEVQALSSATHRFRNEKSRAAALRLRGEDDREERVLFPPRGSVFDFALVESLRKRSPQITSLGAAETEIELSGPTEVLGIGSVITGPLIAGNLPTLVWNEKRQQIRAGLDADVDLFLVVNGFDVGHISFRLARTLVSLIPLECAEQFVSVLVLEPALGLAETFFLRMFDDLLVVDDPDRLLEGMLWTLSGALVACACDASTAGACSIAPAVLDALGAVSFAVDLGLRSWDVATTPSFAEGHLALQGIFVPVPSLGRLTVGEPFEQELRADGGTGDYRWSLWAGSLPPGISLDPETGVLSGTPTAAGEFGATIEARSGGLVGTVSLLFLVDEPSDQARLVGTWQAVLIDGEPLPFLGSEDGDCQFWGLEFALDLRASGELWAKEVERRICPEESIDTWWVDLGSWTVEEPDSLHFEWTHSWYFRDGEFVVEEGPLDSEWYSYRLIGSELHIDFGLDGDRWWVVFERGPIDFPPLPGQAATQRLEAPGGDVREPHERRGLRSLFRTPRRPSGR